MEPAAPRRASLPSIPPDKKKKVIRVHPLDAHNQPLASVMIINASSYDPAHHKACTPEDQKWADVEMKAKGIASEQSEMTSALKRLTRGM